MTIKRNHFFLVTSLIVFFFTSLAMEKIKKDIKKRLKDIEFTINRISLSDSVGVTAAFIPSKINKEKMRIAIERALYEDKNVIYKQKDFFNLKYLHSSYQHRVYVEKKIVKEVSEAIEKNTPIVYVGFGAGNFESDFRILGQLLDKKRKIQAIHFIDPIYFEAICLAKTIKEIKTTNKERKEREEKIKKAAYNILKSNNNLLDEAYTQFTRSIKCISLLSFLAGEKIELYLHENVDAYLKFLEYKSNIDLKKANVITSFQVANSIQRELTAPFQSDFSYYVDKNKKLRLIHDPSHGGEILNLITKGIKTNGLVAIYTAEPLTITKITKELQAKAQKKINEKTNLIDKKTGEILLKFRREKTNLKKLIRDYQLIPFIPPDETILELRNLNP